MRPVLPYWMLTASLSQRSRAVPTCSRTRPSARHSLLEKCQLVPEDKFPAAQQEREHRARYQSGNSPDQGPCDSDSDAIFEMEVRERIVIVLERPGARENVDRPTLKDLETVVKRIRQRVDDGIERHQYKQREKHAEEDIKGDVSFGRPSLSLDLLKGNRFNTCHGINLRPRLSLQRPISNNYRLARAQRRGQRTNSDSITA